MLKNSWPCQSTRAEFECAAISLYCGHGASQGTAMEKTVWVVGSQARVVLVSHWQPVNLQ